MASPAGALDSVSLADLLDRVLDVGAVIAGDVVLSLAGTDLVHLGPRLLLASAATLQRQRQEAGPGETGDHGTA
ncbi:MAG: gas vesicle protein [Acidimicrobiales bacterium]